MKKRLSISDIANNLGVSVTTVSFILNGKAKEKRISDALAKRVLDYVKKVDYKPNQLAKSLRTGKSKSIGLLVEDISNPFFANIADRIEKLAYDHGYHIIYCSMKNDEQRAKELIQLFYDRQIDGFIIAPTEGLSDVINNLLKSSVPVVLFDRPLADVDTHTVISENVEGAYQGTMFLLEQKNAKRIGFVTTNSTQSQMKGRLEGYMKAVDNVGMDLLVKKINPAQTEEEVVSQLKDFISDNKLDAVLFATNYLAINGLKAIKQYQLEVDKLISFDENTTFGLVNPPVSAISQNIQEIAQEVVRILVNQIHGKLDKIEKVVIPCNLIAR
ncbi:LacI family DNA-binding transcriptional regulator [Sphingobacterium litopenaei]|jgi:LacI family transcriptional regulator|uniref:LacI family DNA-binding transcriptional regulator n=1 Tax=Sphingobacterium litopenaei TaxID=2763500 RepID=A0ABR7YBB5_9SPHI|nr:LacI family DNA-binding transcriptional regulator [Sphingobacterium litopenaei]MBD1428598.1 LacI family DNA-binding transcriptional regulator [Sphingobacterium litopenaei]